jgi:DNA (cytosine-5)-methyltransferase 1
LTLTVGSLFSGIGGIDLGLELAGMRVRWQVEIDPWCQRVLEKHWPNVDRYDDVRAVGLHNLERVDVIAGGFPCQDISVAGDGLGIEDGERSGLWTEFARIVRELRPRYVLVENVSALLVRGLGRVIGDLAESGYDAEWDCLPAAAIGAPHRRDRVFVVAHDRSQRIQGRWSRPLSRVSEFSWCEDVRGVEDLRGRSDLPPSLLRGTRDGIPLWVDRLRGIGNAVVPPLVEIIGRQIVEADRAMRTDGQSIVKEESK